MTTTLDTPASWAIDGGAGLREGYARVGDVDLHYVEAGDGPLVLLLHGFPEFWYGWREQIAPLVKAGFRVVAPDLRGYNLSSKPNGFTDYTSRSGGESMPALSKSSRRESTGSSGWSHKAARTPRSPTRWSSVRRPSSHTSGTS